MKNKNAGPGQPLLSVNTMESNVHDQCTRSIEIVRNERNKTMIDIEIVGNGEYKELIDQITSAVKRTVTKYNTKNQL